MPFTCPYCPQWGSDFSSPTLSGLVSHLDQCHPHPKRGSLTVTFTPEELDYLCALMGQYRLDMKLPQGVDPSELYRRLSAANIPAC